MYIYDTFFSERKKRLILSNIIYLKGEKMTINNMNRGGCVDVFHSYILKNVKYAGEFDFPVIRGLNVVPRKMIVFSKALREKKDFHQWVCFYEDDYKFERIWNNPKKYINCLKKFDGVVSPDFSLFYDMPFAMQIWNIFRSRTIAALFQKEGIKVLPNIRFGDERTFEVCCQGISKHSTIVIGSLGCLKEKNTEKYLKRGFYMFQKY